MTTQIISENTAAQNASGTLSSGVEDTFLSSLAADTNNDGAGDLRTDVFSGGTIRQSSVLRFTIPTAPAGESLVSATLYLYQTYNGGTAGNVDVHAVLRAWVETEATWNSYSTGNSWTTAGAQSDGNDRVGTPTDTVSIASGYGTGNGTYAFAADVTADIGTYNTWLVIGDNATDVSLNWDNSEGTDGQRPELVLVYEASGGSILPLINAYYS